MNLFLDTTQSDLILILFTEQHQIKAVRSFYNHQLHSETLIKTIATLCQDQNLNLRSDLKKIYVCTGPGSFMGTRAALTFIKTCALVIKPLKIYVMSSLLFNVANPQPTISVLSITKRLVVIAGYQNWKLCIPKQIIPAELWPQMKQDFERQAWQINIDYHNITYPTTLIQKLNSFTKIKNCDHLEMEMPPRS